MATKAEISEEINERLGTDIEWEEMKKDDLVKFREGLEDEQFIKRVLGQFMNDRTGDRVQEQIEGWQPGQFLGLAAQVVEGQQQLGGEADELEQFFG